MTATPENGGTPVVATEVVMTTYKLASGGLVAGDFGWVTDLDYFEQDGFWEPVELVEERWVRAEVKTTWHMPEINGSCEFEDEEPCEEDATGWWQSPDGVWLRACEKPHGRDAGLGEVWPDGQGEPPRLAWPKASLGDLDDELYMAEKEAHRG